MKKALKVVVLIIVIIGSLFLWYDQSRSFFKASNDEFITVWKRWGGTCYLIPGKYYGVTKPTDNYIETKNKNENVVFLWRSNKSNELLYFGNIEDRIYNNGKSHFRIVNYLDDKQENDSLYTEKNGDYSRYKKGVIFLSVNILSGYAGDGTGETQR